MGEGAIPIVGFYRGVGIEDGPVIRSESNW